jgi:hypothetical protein
MNNATIHPAAIARHHHDKYDDELRIVRLCRRDIGSDLPGNDGGTDQVGRRR